MKLMTKEMLRTLPNSNAIDDEMPASKRPVHSKLFDPCGRFTMFVLDGITEEDDTILFGYVVSPLGEDCDELGYMSVREMESIKNRYGLGIERDIHFESGMLLRDALTEHGVDPSLALCG